MVSHKKICRWITFVRDWFGRVVCVLGNHLIKSNIAKKVSYKVCGKFNIKPL